MIILKINHADKVFINWPHWREDVSYFDTDDDNDDADCDEGSNVYEEIETVVVTSSEEDVYDEIYSDGREADRGDNEMHYVTSSNDDDNTEVVDSPGPD
ncbi:unnamed protein product [Rodentolepis nana]|uniref:H/ACA ribonucleoprotein complex subunit n=1 Tax=Rodentolepis nana TaxID=102285 RepID=A0A0R3TLG9_RODNA|nr:unnamed protein product [Rodentolepis nana]